jgi:hypothetical protein
VSRRKSALFCATVVLLSICAATPASAESWLKRLLRISGLTASPSQMKAPEEAPPGNVWVADLERKTSVQLTREGLYRWPVFVPGSDDVIALQRDRLVRIAPRGSLTDLGKPARLVKLVGFDQVDPDLLLIVVDARAAGSPLALFSLRRRTSNPLPFQRASAVHRQMLEHIRGQERVYGNVTVYVKTETEEALTRTYEWSNVYLARDGGEPQNVSACRRVDCSQPSLAPDGTRVAFIQSSDE